jgi:glycosyltransferase involved in cell wall biosynthesis
MIRYKDRFLCFSNKNILFLVPKGIHSIERSGEIIKRYIEGNSYNANIVLESLYAIENIKKAIKDIDILCIHAPLQECFSFMDAFKSLVDKKSVKIITFPVWEEDLYSFYAKYKKTNHSLNALTSLYQDEYVDYIGLYSFILYEQVDKLFPKGKKHFYMDFEEFHFKSVETNFQNTDTFNILYNFAGMDFWRKNPLAIVEACNVAFKSQDKIIITLKTSKLSEEHKELLLKASKHKLNLINEFLDEKSLDKLYENADVYVSSHVYEGFGLTILEAIKKGKKVVASCYGGYSDYLSGIFEEIFYVKAKKSSFGHVNPPLEEDSIVYYPDVNHMANILQYLYMKKFGVYIFGNSRIYNMVKDILNIHNIKLNGIITDNEPNTLRPIDVLPHIKTIVAVSSKPTIEKIKQELPNSLSYYEFLKLLKNLKY